MDIPGQPAPPNAKNALLIEGKATLRLVADYFEGRIDGRAFRTRFPHHRVISANPLVIEPEQGSFVYLQKFGAIVFWNCSDRVIATLHEELGDLSSLGTRVEGVRDHLTVHVGAAEERVGFSEVWLRDCTLDRLKIVSLALAQSVALEHFEVSVRGAMAKFEPVMAGLAHRGRLFLTHLEAMKIIGFTMEIRAAVLENLTLFDDPPETWESESLAHLDSDLFGQFDLAERLGAIQQKLAYLSDAAAKVIDLLTTRKSHRLEWIVIILIALEIVFFLAEKLPALLRH
ncbi:MAG: RMD1 family protein [Holophaga sp.]|nr:RMD1 family protein [Holophaga sp.]